MRRTWLFIVFTIASLLSAPLPAQVEFKPTVALDLVNVITPTVSEDRPALLLGLNGSYRAGPWRFSGEFADGSLTDMTRVRGEVGIGYSLTESIDIAAGARVDDIELTDTDLVFFIIFPVPITSTVADVDLMNGFVGADFESDSGRGAALLGSARLYRGTADVRAGRESIGGECEGFRGELAVRLGTAKAPYIVGVAYEEFQVPDADVEISSKPIVFVSRRYSW